MALLEVLEELVKARRAKGLENWRKLESLQAKLTGKQASHIEFTSCYPGQEGSKKYLGSHTGNLHFLLGYVNPGFHVAPYHWQLVDPQLTDEEAAGKQHPAVPRYWEASGLPIEDEGDVVDGKPHPFASANKKARATRAAKRPGAVVVKAGYGDYVLLPEEGKVYSLTNGHLYEWSLLRESYLAYTNPEVRAVMDPEAQDDTDAGIVKSVQGRPKTIVEALRGQTAPFDDDVFQLVKSILPKPGSVLVLGEGESRIYARVRPARVDLYDADGFPTTVSVFGREYTNIDLRKGGDIHPSILLNFVTEATGTSKGFLVSLAKGLTLE